MASLAFHCEGGPVAVRDQSIKHCPSRQDLTLSDKTVLRRERPASRKEKTPPLYRNAPLTPRAFISIIPHTWPGFPHRQALPSARLLP